MRGKDIFKKVLVSLLILSMSLSSVSVAAQDGHAQIQEQQAEPDAEKAEAGSLSDVPDENLPEDTVLYVPGTADAPQTVQPDDEASDPEVLPDVNTETGSEETEGDGEDSSDQASSETNGGAEVEGSQDTDGAASDGTGQETDGAVPDGVGQKTDETEGSQETGSGTVDGVLPDGGDKPAASENQIPETPEDPADEEEEEEDYSDLLTPEDLAKLPENEVGATTWMDQPSGRARMRSFSSRGVQAWSFNAYFMNNGDEGSYEITKTNDFDLKYQMEFHAGRDFSAGEIEIRIPAALLTYRNGSTGDVQREIAVPKAEWGEDNEGNPVLETVSSRSTSFNYYEDEEGNLVFFNYKEIKQGTNSAWQVLYKNLKIMEIEDGTTWTLTPEITVPDPDSETGGEVKEEADPLILHIESGVTLSSVSVTPYSASDKSYTPGLYSRKQVETYLENRDDLTKFLSGNGKEFSDYRYVVWSVKISGNATQPWTVSPESRLSMVNSAAEGTIVGYKERKQEGIRKDIRNGVRYDSSFQEEYYVVTAFPAEQTDENALLKYDLAFTMHPLDGKDADLQREASAQWSYADYEWKYPSGENFIITKAANHSDYAGWLNAYRLLPEGEDYGGLSFTTKTSFRGYHTTHITGGAGLGEYIPGTSYEMTASDDFMYVYLPESKTHRMMDDKDYYFSSIKVTQKDVGYDVWESQEEPLQSAEGSATEVYAMYQGSATWEKAGEIPWDPSGVMGSFVFSQDQIDRQPWRVKAVHQSTHYRTDCTIDVEACIRGNSPVMQDVLSAAGTEKVTIENISAGFGTSQDAEGKLTYYGAGPDAASASINDRETNTVAADGHILTVAEATKELYGLSAAKILPWRANALVSVSEYDVEAKATKTAKSTNDVDNSRVLVDYCLTAYDGYRVGRQEDLNYLRGSGHLVSPGKNQVVFYDLLPYGMRFDPSEKVRAGRITNLRNNDYAAKPGNWDNTQVEVRMDSARDIIENYHGTGRTMLIFHLTYTGSDPSVYTAGRWMEGWGVSFRAYYDWKDRDLMKKDPERSSVGANICAFMPEDGSASLLGVQDKEVFRDNGTYPSGQEKIYEDFASPIHSSSAKGIYRVLYAEEVTDENLTIASETKVTKLVRADSDRFGIYKEDAAVNPGEGYTYDITISTTASLPLKGIVVYDCLEDSVSGEGEAERWYGTFDSVVINGLTKMGITPVVYYNDRRDAAVRTENSAAPADVLKPENGWYTEEDFISNHSGQEGGWKTCVQSVAVDLRMAGSEEFELNGNKSVSFQIRMTAPVSEGLSEEQKAAAVCNRAGYYADRYDDVTWGSPVQVRLKENGTLKIVKEFTGDVPEASGDTAFEFQILDESGEKYQNKEYQFWKRSEESGEFVQVEDRLYATDANGCLKLHADEQAVFVNVPDIEAMQIKETESLFWKSEKLEDGNQGDGERTVTFRNEYRPVLYVQKVLTGVPESADTKAEEFTFRLRTMVDGEPVPQAVEYCYVNQVRTDGGSPKKVESSWYPQGDSRRQGGVTGEDGSFPIHAGEIIALFPGSDNTEYIVDEIGGAGEGTNWICQEDTVKVTLPSNGAGVSIENCYRWKELYLEKKITHQDPSECTQSFTFKIEKAAENGGGDSGAVQKRAVRGPVRAARDLYWELLEKDASGNLVPAEPDPANPGAAVSGPVGADGTFTCACAGRTVRVRNLEADATYIITETDPGELYVPVQDMAEVTMPLFSSKAGVSFTNDYQRRSLSVSKTVIFDPSGTEKEEDVKDREFWMEVKIDRADGKGLTLLKDTEYTLFDQGKEVESKDPLRTDGEGRLPLKDGQTAVFKDLGWPDWSYQVTEEQPEIKEGETAYTQIYPSGQQPHTGKFANDHVNASFINANPDAGALYITKEYEWADEASREMAEWDWEFDLVNKYNEHGIDKVFESDREGAERFADSYISYVLEHGYDIRGEKEEYAEYFAALGMTSLDDYGGNIEQWAAEMEALHYSWKPEDIRRQYEEGVVLSESGVKVELTVNGELFKGKVKVIYPVARRDEFGDPEYDEEYNLIIDHMEVKEDEWDQDVFLLAPAWTVMIPKEELEPYRKDGEEISYSLRELEEYQHRVQCVKADAAPSLYAEISQKIPLEDKAVTGIVGKDMMATIVNQIKFFYMGGSEFAGKFMTGNSDDVPVGARLVWKLERYNGQEWEPAEGVTYAVGALKSDFLLGEFGGIFDSDQIGSDRLFRTDADGRIELFKTGKTADGMETWPAAYFLADADGSGLGWNTPGAESVEDCHFVYLNRYTGMKAGDLRVTEVPEESDPAWGLLAGYAYWGGTGWEYSLGAPETEEWSEGRKIFINSNRCKPVDIAKEMDTPSSESFTMILNQVLSVASEPVSDESDILESRPCKGMEYTVYGSESGKEIRKDVTGSKGEIRLRAGEYARLYLPEETLWTVSEEVKPNYMLKNLTAGTDASGLTLLGEKMLINQSSDLLTVQILFDGLPDFTPLQDLRTYYSVGGQWTDKYSFDKSGLVERSLADGTSVLIFEDALSQGELNGRNAEKKMVEGVPALQWTIPVSDEMKGKGLYIQVLTDYSILDGFQFNGWKQYLGQLCEDWQPENGYGSYMCYIGDAAGQQAGRLILYYEPIIPEDPGQ